MKYWENGNFHLNQNLNGTRKEISEEQWQNFLSARSNGKKIVSNDFGYPEVAEVEKTEEEILYELRVQREIECFSVINRGSLWYNSLSSEQLNELNIWYKDWLNVTITKKIPVKPTWLK